MSERPIDNMTPRVHIKYAYPCVFGHTQTRKATDKKQKSLKVELLKFIYYKHFKTNKAFKKY